ncbi:MAG: FG-GAP-like repeat-containing protein [Candidatus Eisenbacteria bacterium]
MNGTRTTVARLCPLPSAAQFAAAPLAAALLAVALGFAAPARAQLTARPVMQPRGAAAGDNFGRTVAPTGDVNGDGFDDFLIGASRSDINASLIDAGRMYVLLGGVHLDSLPDAIVLGRIRGGLFGATLAGVGDVNADGYDDWIAASPEYQISSPPRLIGKAWLFPGGSALSATSNRVYDLPLSQTSSGLYGSTISGIGDFNADGFADFLISAAVLAPDSFSAFVYLGGPLLDQTEDFSLRTGVGYTVRASCAGDINGDGWRDIVVATSSQNNANPGRLHVFFGGPGCDASPDVTILSSNTFDSFGFAASSGGDLNGDGYDDIVVGAPNRTVGGRSFAGEALIYFGGPALGATPDLIVQGASGGDNLGAAVSIGGDLDGDGYADLVAGAPRADGRGVDSGRAYVCFGGAAMDVIPDLAVDGEAANDLFGTSVAMAGDPDLGGSDAMLVGATQNDAGGSNAGRAYLYRVSRFGILRPGAAARWVAGAAATVEWTGADPATVELSLDDGANWQTLASGVGGSAFNALNVTAPGTTTGRARVRVTLDGSAPGSGASTLSPGLFHIAAIAPAIHAVFDEPADVPAAEPGRLGTSVAAGVDWDGDGAPELMAGAPYAGSGAIAIRSEPFSDESGPVRRSGETPLEQFGSALANVGDLNGDGWDDLAVGSPACAVAGTEAGRVSVFHGGPSADGAPDRIIEGLREFELFGTALAAAGDVNADGHADLVVGAPGSSGDGRAYVYFGGPGFDALPDRILTAGIPGPFGVVVAGAGDVNGDGAGDLLVGGPPMPGGTGSSAVHLIFGNSGAAPWNRMILEGDAPGDGFGSALAGLGDLDDDGFADFGIGAPFTDGGHADAGAVYIFYGTSRFVPRSGMTLYGTAEQEFFGSALAGGADLNGDGRPDFAVGAPGSTGNGPSSGRVDLYFGGSDDQRDATLARSIRSRFGAALAMRGSPEAGLFGVLAVGAPFAEFRGSGAEGQLHGFAAARWRLLQPVSAESWPVGSRQMVSWRGAEPAELWFVGVDGSRTRLAGPVGGAEINRAEVPVASSLADSGHIELRMSDPALRGLAQSARVRLRRTVSLLRFEWEPRGDGIMLEWETDPAVSSAGIAGYRLWRAARHGEPRVRIGAPLIAENSTFDPGGRAGDQYELVALSGQGDEFVAGSLSLPAPPVAIRAWPQPAGESGNVRLSFAAPRLGGTLAGDLEVQVFDARGRWIQTLARGTPETRAGVVELVWDGRTHRGAAAGPGLYFVRARAPSAGFELTRRVVMLDSRER